MVPAKDEVASVCIELAGSRTFDAHCEPTRAHAHTHAQGVYAKCISLGMQNLRFLCVNFSPCAGNNDVAIGDEVKKQKFFFLTRTLRVKVNFHLSSSFSTYQGKKYTYWAC